MAINPNVNAQSGTGGTIATGNISRLLQEGIHKVFGDAYNEHEDQYSKIFDIMTSKKAFEVDTQLEGFGLAAAKAEGDDIKFDSRRQGFTPKYINTTYAKGFVVTMEAMQDDLYNEMTKGAKALARSMRQTKEIVHANILNRGFDASQTMVDGDGLSLFNAAHVNGPSGGTFSNQLAVAADLTEASLEDMLIQINEAEDARGLKIALQGLKLIVAPGNQYNAQRILGSVLQNDTGNNATNAVRDMNSLRDGFVVNNYLTDADAWFIKTDSPQGLQCFNRMSVEFGEDDSFSSANMRYRAVERYVPGWTDPRGVYGSAGA